MEFAEWYDPNEPYECAFCGKIIERGGYDPCRVDVESHRLEPNDPGSWLFWVHAACVRDALSTDLRDAVGYSYEPGHVEPPLEQS